MAFGGGNYEIRIKGRLSDSLLAAFESLTATVEPVQTVLYGPVPDQSSLHGLLDRIQSLGLELVEIRWLPASPDEPAPEPEPPVRPVDLSMQQRGNTTQGRRGVGPTRSP